MLDNISGIIISAADIRNAPDEVRDWVLGCSVCNMLDVEPAAHDTVDDTVDRDRPADVEPYPMADYYSVQVQPDAVTVADFYTSQVQPALRGDAQPLGAVRMDTQLLDAPVKYHGDYLEAAKAFMGEYGPPAMLGLLREIGVERVSQCSDDQAVELLRKMNDYDRAQ